MGEAKQRAEARKQAIGSSAKPDLSPETLTELARVLIAQGLLIEAGFAGLRAAAIPAAAPPVQVEEMRNAFFAGAQHLFNSVMSVLDPEDEVTEDDMERMNKISAELEAFIDDFELRRLPTQGRA